MAVFSKQQAYTDQGIGFSFFRRHESDHEKARSKKSRRREEVKKTASKKSKSSYGVGAGVKSEIKAMKNDKGREARSEADERTAGARRARGEVRFDRG